MMRNALHVFLALAFILSGISPACAFISGKSSIEIEICTNDGIKTVTLPVDAPAEDYNPGHEKKNDCAFCFAQTHLKTAKADAVLISYVPKIFDEQRAAFTAAAVHRFELASLSARAPPLL